ncbi:MAG: DUF5060 domain-containing protein [Luteitalea sp.]|nr:DUF5060 domain-containing protein [Luteitalea sp.]
MNRPLFGGLLLGTASLFVLLSAATSQDTEESAIVPLDAHGPPEISDLRVNSDEIGLYEKFEITFDLSGDWDNPFDLDQVSVAADFHAPDGQQLAVPGFFYQEYRLDENGSHRTVGSPVWKVRFTPVRAGEHSYQVIVNNKGEKITTPSHTFSSVQYHANHGFLRISQTNPLYFEFDDRTPFFGVAMGRCCGDNAELQRLYRRFAPVGGNYNRLFLTNGPYDIEELNTSPNRPDRGLGRMNLETSWNLDNVLELGEQLGIYHIVTLTNQWTFNHRWEDHVFNKANGGILDAPDEYWTSEQAMEYLERRVRYIIARWGYSTSVFSWDLWNEYSAMPGSDLSVAIPWHQRMARYISSLDAFDHVIHTNDGSLNGRDQMHQLPEMEVVSTNSYMVTNIANVAEFWTKRHTGQFHKPYVLTEFGTGHSVGAVGGYAGMDPERRMVHDGLWSPLISGSASTGLAWEGNWLDHEIFYTYVKAVSRFVEGIPFSKRKWSPVDVASLRFNNAHTSNSNQSYGDVIVEGWSGNFRRSDNVPDVFQIDRDGHVDHQESLNAELTGSPGRRDTSSVAFEAEYPGDGEFVVYITEVRNTEPTPQLTVTVDDEEVLREDVLALEIDDYHPIMHNQYYTIPISGGAHTIRIENTGGGSFVTAFELKDYIRRDALDLEVRGLQCDDYILLWLKNQKFTLLHDLMDVELKPQPEGRLELEHVPDGTWIAEWMNTIDAASVRTEVVESTNQRLVLSTPVVEESVAVRLRKM